MGNTVSTVGDALVHAAVWATRDAPARDPTSTRSRTAGAAALAPSYDDVLAVLDLLSYRLPPEIALQVLDASEYWPAVSRVWTGNLTVSAGPLGRRTARLAVVSPPVPSVPTAPRQPVRRVSVWTDSRDQGYSSFPQHHATRDGSSSWFELVLLRPDEPEPARPSTPSSDRDDDDHHAPPAPALPPELATEQDSLAADAELLADPDGGGTRWSPVRSVRLHSNLHSVATFVPFTTVLSLSPRSSPSSSPSSSCAAPTIDALSNAIGVIEPATPGCCDPDQARDLLQHARAGDRFAVRVCAEYPMWVNRVRGCAVKVEVAVV